MIQIGDRVRFLSDVGGGIVVGFQGKGIVLVEDEDGFQMPVPVNEVVVITTTDHNIAIPQPTSPKPSSLQRPSLSKEQPAPLAPVSEDPAERPITYKPKPFERKDGEQLNLYLDFLPVDIKEFTRTTFETYLVNDCNYYVAYTYLSRENAVWHLRAQGIAEPNTKVFLEEINHAQLNDIEHITLQTIAWKQDKPFVLKPSLTLQPRMDTTKFYKLHTFHPSLFFDEPVLEIPLVLNDQPVRPLHVSSESLQQAMQEKHDIDNSSHQSQHTSTKQHKSKKLSAQEILEVDLHAHELLETTAGMTPSDIKEYQLQVFRNTMDAHIKDIGRRIVFIHGKGEGALRAAILAELKHRYKSCLSQDASFQQYGFGATMVTIKH